jgi:hypothetical protein
MPTCAGKMDTVVYRLRNLYGMLYGSIRVKMVAFERLVGENTRSERAQRAW